MGTISEKYKRDLLSYIRSIMFWSTFAFTMTPLRRQNFFPYYLGIVSACMIAALVVVVWKCKDEDVRDTANVCIVYILMCMSFTQL